MVTANTTDDGSAVYRRADGTWASQLENAEPMVSEAERDAALADARTQERKVCDPYAFRVELGPQGPIATNVREQIRGVGPTTPLRWPVPATTRMSA